MRAGSRTVQKARWLQNAMSAAEWSPPYARVSPRQSARRRAPGRGCPVMMKKRAASYSSMWCRPLLRRPGGRRPRTSTCTPAPPVEYSL
jgi:hypothetical protein